MGSQGSRAVTSVGSQRVSLPGWSGASWAKAHELPRRVLAEMSHDSGMNGGVLDCVRALGRQERR